MRRRHFAALFLLPAGIFVAMAAAESSLPTIAQTSLPTSGPTEASSCDKRCSAQWMDANLRLDQLQVVGTAESYKQRPAPALLNLIRMGGKKGVEALDYGQAPLAAQLDGDVRALQFDIAYDPQGGAYKNPAGASMAMELLPDAYLKEMAKPGFKVIHVLDVDYRSSCPAFRECLKQVAAWSQAHPHHLPIFISLTLQDAKTPMPGATAPLICNEQAMDALDSEIRAAFPADRMITPDQLQGNHASLREAATSHAWPSLAQARGKVVFVLNDNAAKVKAYQGARKSLEGRVLFVTADAASPLAAFLSIPDPVKNGERIRQAVRDGFIVLTRADEDTSEARKNDGARRTAAFASGAQIVQTDFATADPAIGPYRVSLKDNPKAMCGAELAPQHCVSFSESGPVMRTAAAAAP
jgi:hypothetical protein